MVNTQPSQSNPVDLTLHEESLLHLTNHSVGEGTTRYHRGGLVDQQININIILHCRNITADFVSPTDNQSLHTISDLLCKDNYNSMLSTSNASDVLPRDHHFTIWVVSAEHRLHQAGSQRLSSLQETSASQELHTRGAINKLHSEYNVWCCLQ